MLPLFLPFLADASGGVEQWIMPILQTGAVGAVLVWFMLRAEGRMKAIETAIDRAARANLVLAMALDPAGNKIREHARAIDAEIDGGKTPA